MSTCMYSCKLGAVPEEPTSLSADAGPLWARISWQPPVKPNGMILYYLLLVEEATFGANATTFNTTDPHLEFTVTSLNPYTCYSYTVTAGTAAGTGEQASKHFFCTEQYGMAVYLAMHLLNFLYMDPILLPPFHPLQHPLHLGIYRSVTWSHNQPSSFGRAPPTPMDSSPPTI